jgi:hypothetical protein
MRPLTAILFAGLLLGLSGAATAQSLTPMERSGITPTGTKGFKLLVGNPYPNRMTFLVLPMDPSFVEPVTDAVAKPSRVTIGPGHGRAVILAFKIDPAQKERTIGLCIVPEKFEGPILPRVCGRYTGRMARN